MHKSYASLFLGMLFLTSQLITAQIEEDRLSPYALFEANEGQWEGDFDFRLELRSGAVFFEDGGYTVTVFNPEQVEGIHHHDELEGHTHEIVKYVDMQRINYRVNYLGSNRNAATSTQFEKPFYRNYFRGNDPSKWASDIKLFGAVSYLDFYPNIDARHYSQDDNFKYDFVVHPGGNPESIQWSVEGTEMEIIEGELHYPAPFGDIVEWHPIAYQLINGRKEYVDVDFQLENGVASFALGAYDESVDLIIDPTIVFATFSGSTSDNWGFTATFDLNGGLYGGGICFSSGYPTSAGVFDPTYNPGPNPNDQYIDATISKYSADGKSLLYATYYGGAESDQPHSMVVNSQGQLIVYGATGSDDLPMPVNGADTSFGGGPSTNPFKGVQGSYDFPNGTDAFIAVFSPNGQNLVGATYIGGSGRDAINSSIQRNYGDGARGEVVVDDSDNIYVVTTTFSTDYPLVNSGVGGNAGACDAGVTKLNPNATSFIWSTLYGGSVDDQGYGIKVASNGFVFITGGTLSANLPGMTNGANDSYSNNTDGFIARFTSGGALSGATYLGTAAYDQSFLIDTDKNNAVYVFGQSQGNYPRTANVWGSGSPRQFVHKFSNDLTRSIWSTAFGSTSSGGVNLVPTAFNVDECLNILISGWGGAVNNQSNYLGGNVRGLPISSDAVQKTTDGSDFYFMQIAANATALNYATYFGGSVNEHVDGGTSRFSPEGEIYQAVCAGCGGSNSFPVTSGAYSTTNNSGNCNLGNVKFNFEVSIEAAASIDYDADVDTVCNTLNVQFSNGSRNANVYQWDFGNGQSSSLEEPSTSYTNFGTYDVVLIAIDTICDISDTAYLQIEHTQGIDPEADFDLDFTTCDATRTVYITNRSRRATNYLWDMGNGDQITTTDVQYSYPVEGQYAVTLYALDTVCDKVDTLSKLVNFVTDIPPPIVNVTPSDCDNGKIDVWYLNDSSYYQYRWEWEDGTVEWAKFPNTKVPYSGSQVIKLSIIDTVCNSRFEYTFTLDVTRIDNRVYIPNAFSPNGDGINDVLLLKGNTCLLFTRFEIYNRWGQRVFSTDKPFSEFWNGRFENGTLKQDTYVWKFFSEDGEKAGFVTIIP
ncbi:MAG: gliding motility-associated C-terminal domain-containing protein [Flavobacteriia bacterium]|nr:gliding motility-associated C-terminal domain-containing protein [Flavobacteriia bacterium]